MEDKYLFKLWIDKQDLNPFTKKKIKINGPTWKKLMKKYNDFFSIQEDISQTNSEDKPVLDIELNKYNDNINQQINSIDMNISKSKNSKKLKIDTNISKNKIEIDNNNNDLEKTFIIDSYKKFRKKKIDPIMNTNIDYNLIFTYPYKWNNFTGEKNGIDENGPLNFDSHYLIYFFYKNRLNNLWNITDDNIDGYYGDAINNGSNFTINGRGNHPEWYLFRLPLIDCYIPKNFKYNYITMGPILNYDEIVEIYNKSLLTKNKFYKRFKINLPNIIKIYELYHDAIREDSLLNFFNNNDLSPQTIKSINSDFSKNAIEQLKNL